MGVLFEKQEILNLKWLFSFQLIDVAFLDKMHTLVTTHFKFENSLSEF